jgi:shikimate dehydrogenase
MSDRIPILAVAGRPVLHSLSPVIFRELFRASGTRAAYTRLAAEDAAEAISIFRALGMRGMNLTAPLKETAAALLGAGRGDELAAEARGLGAVNCLVGLEGGRVRGANTDPQGVLGALRARGVEIRGARCLVLGAGGAGKAAAFALKSAGGEVTIANRTRFRAEDAAAQLGCGAAALDGIAELAASADIIASTLASDALPDPESWFPELGVGRSRLAVLDADYKKGALAAYASVRGAIVASGTEWLLGQALPAYELFMGAEARSVSEAEREALAALLGSACREDAASAAAKAGKIALVGLMGSGKTAVGKALASRMSLPFVDSDEEIVSEAAASIPEIFAREGEDGFRAREARAIDRISSRPGPAVIATGGGAPSSKSSAALLAERCLPVWLYVTPKTAAERSQRGPGGTASRPLLAGWNPEERLGLLEADRRGAYASLSELVVSTEGRSSGEVAEIIHDEIGSLS